MSRSFRTSPVMPKVLCADFLKLYNSKRHPFGPNKIYLSTCFVPDHRSRHLQDVLPPRPQAISKFFNQHEELILIHAGDVSHAVNITNDDDV